MKQAEETGRRASVPIVEGVCPMPDIAKLIGGKWKLIILQILVFKGTRRFGELKREVDGVTQTMLTGQLRALERDGLVRREVYPEVPPRVEYSATRRAFDLKDVFLELHAWWTKSEAADGDDGERSSNRSRVPAETLER